MSWEERQAIIEARKRARSANNTNVNGDQDAESTIAGPPTAINVGNGTNGNNNNNRQTNMKNQGSQPGTMIRNMMSSASTRSANASTRARQDEVTINGTTYRSVNATVRYHISQQASDVKVRGSLVDGCANGGLLGDDVHILEHAPNGYVNITGVAGNEIANLKLAQAAALVDTMADGPIILIMLQYANYGTGQ